MAKDVGAMILFIFWQERKADVQKLGNDLETVVLAWDAGKAQKMLFL